MALIGIHLKAIVERPKRSAGVPISGAAESVLCPRCQHTIASPAERWETLAAAAVVPDPGEPVQLQRISCGAGLEVDGTTPWRSVATARYDREAEESLRGKKGG